MGFQENKAIVERFDRLISACELKALDQICTPGMINHSLASGRPPGLAGTKEWLAETEREVAFMYRLDAGRIAERWALRDDLGMILHLTTASPQSAVEGAAR